MSAYPPPAPQAPVPSGFLNIFRKWVNVTTHPGAQSFASELPTANWGDIWIGLAIVAVVTAALGFFILEIVRSIALNALANNPQIPPDQLQGATQVFNALPSFAVAYLALVPIGFFFSMGVYWLFAKMFGGTGSFRDQAYAYSLFYVPLQTISALLVLIPFLGGLVSAGLGIYSIVLTVYSVMASHRLSGGRATAVVLLPIALVFILACALAVILIIAFGGHANSVTYNF